MGTTGPRHAAGATTQRRPWKVVRFVLASGVLLGVGAGLTSAAWTDDAVFRADASTPTVQLQGGAGQVPSLWLNADPANADGKGTAVTIPASAFASLAPGVPATTHVGLKNASTVPLIVPIPAASWSGDFASGACALAAVTTVTINGASATVTLPAAATTTDVLISVTPPTSWNGSSTCQNKTGTLTLTFTGATS